jgi:Zn-finger nucleic acid-binding protein
MTDPAGEAPEARALQCPKCPDTALEGVQGEGVAVDRCPTCGGIWFDAHELERALEAKHSGLTMRVPKPVDEVKDAQKAVCPECKTPMIKLNSLSKPRVVMDACKVCHGRWLDGGEFEKLKGTGVLGRLKRVFGF